MGRYFQQRFASWVKSGKYRHFCNSNFTVLFGVVVDGYGIISTLSSEAGPGGTTKRYQPAKPLGKINLFQFKKALDDYGNSEGKELILGVDPLIREYTQKAEDNLQAHWESKTLEDLLRV